MGKWGFWLQRAFCGGFGPTYVHSTAFASYLVWGIDSDDFGVRKEEGRRIQFVVYKELNFE